MKKAFMFPILAIVITLLSVCMVGCGSQAPASDSSSDIKIYFPVERASDSYTGIASLNSNGGGKTIIQEFQGGATNTGFYESVQLAPNGKILIAQYERNDTLHKHYMHMLHTSGTDMHSFWPETLGTIPCRNPSFGKNSDLTFITGETTSVYIGYASAETETDSYPIYTALCLGSPESRPCLSMTSSYDAFNKDGDIWVKKLNSTEAVFQATATSGTTESCPAFSPVNEKQIAYICQDSTGYYIAKKDDYSSGSGVMLTAGYMNNICPPIVWSDDGAYIYFIAYGVAPQTTIYRISVTPTTQDPIVDSPTTVPYVDLKKLPGSTRLFFVKRRTTGTCEVWSVNPTTFATLEVNSDTDNNYFNWYDSIY